MNADSNFIAWASIAGFLVGAGGSVCGGVALFVAYASGGFVETSLAYGSVALFILAGVASDVGSIARGLASARSASSVELSSRPCGPESTLGAYDALPRHEGTVRRLTTDFEGPDGAGPCVVALDPRKGGYYHGDRGRENRGVAFVLERSDDSIVIVGGPETWGFMRVAETSLRPASRIRWLRRLRGMAEPLPGSNSGRWLCLREGDYVVLWCNLAHSQRPTGHAPADADDGDYPYRDRPPGPAPRHPGVPDRRWIRPSPNEDVTNRIGAGTLAEQRRQWWWQWRATGVWMQIAAAYAAILWLIWFFQ